MQQIIDFNGYPIIQDDRFLKMTQDTALLSDFAKLKKKDRVLDIGAGVGSLGILLLVKNKDIITDGIEIEPEAAKIAQQNYHNCGFAGRGEIIIGDMKEMKAPDTYTVCISNPPYFDVKRGKTSQMASVATARAEHNATITHVCQLAKRVLKWGGRLYFCYKPERLDKAFSALYDNQFAIKRLCFVHQRAEKPANLVLVEARYGGGEWCQVEPPIVIENTRKEKL